jgi:hypothetical protein
MSKFSSRVVCFGSNVLSKILPKWQRFVQSSHTFDELKINQDLSTLFAQDLSYGCGIIPTKMFSHLWSFMGGGGWRERCFRKMNIFKTFIIKSISPRGILLQRLFFVVCPPSPHPFLPYPSHHRHHHCCFNTRSRDFQLFFLSGNFCHLNMLLLNSNTLFP